MVHPSSVGVGLDAIAIWEFRRRLSKGRPDTIEWMGGVYLCRRVAPTVYL
ncbi:hypothetical protein [Coleofasciculus sp.]